MGDAKKMTTIAESIIPLANGQYLDAAFWEQRYAHSCAPADSEDQEVAAKGVTREWLVSYAMFADVFRKAVPKTASILILGICLIFAQ